ncbi:MAG: potassium-transporting ATPase subunit C [Verrucomicrobia bacterium]|nr:potassium-transporting ATPase subunit C [Verrucomicrobiota bacterium]
MKTKFWQWLIGIVVAFAVAAIVCYQYLWDGAIRPVSELTEKAAAVALLAAKLTGPQYFIAPPNTTLEDGELWIDVTDAWPQVPRIAAERKLDPERTRAIGRLIEKLSEPHPYRVVGGERVNLLRLNLSLDAIK